MSKPDWLIPEREARITETIQMLRESQGPLPLFKWYEGRIIPIILFLLIIAILIVGPLMNWW